VIASEWFPYKNLVFLVALTSMGTLIDEVGSRGFGATRKGGMGGSLAVDKDGGQTETVLGSAEEAEHDMD